MKTIRYRKDGEHTIVTGLDELPDDPVRTMKKVQPIIYELPETEKLSNLNASLKLYRTKRSASEGKILSAQKIQNAAESLLDRVKSEFEKTNLNTQIQRSKSLISDEQKNKSIFDARIKELEEKMLELHKILDQKRKEIIKNNIVYAFARKNEIPLTDDEFEEISAVFNNKRPHEQIAIEFDEIESVVVEADENQPEIRDIVRKIKGSPKLINDMRGKQFFWKDKSGKWRKSKEGKLGESKIDLIPTEFEDNAFELSELDEDAREEIRIQSMDSNEKANEKKQKIDEILRESAFKRMELEIQGNKNALEIAQDFYKEKVSKLESKYIAGT